MDVLAGVFAGAARSPITRAILPLRALFHFAKLTPGRTAAFADEFNNVTTIEPGPAGKCGGLSGLEQP